MESGQVSTTNGVNGTNGVHLGPAPIGVKPKQRKLTPAELVSLVEIAKKAPDVDSLLRSVLDKLGVVSLSAMEYNLRRLQRKGISKKLISALASRRRASFAGSRSKKNEAKATDEKAVAKPATEQKDGGKWERQFVAARLVDRSDAWVALNARKGKIRRKRSDDGVHWLYNLADVYKLAPPKKHPPTRRPKPKKSRPSQNHAPKANRDGHLQMKERIDWVLDGYKMQEFTAEESLQKIARIVHRR